jgi:MFS family permease
MYIDKRAPDELKAQAQGFIFLITFGLGLLAGNLIDGRIIGFFTKISGGIRVYNWDSIWGITSIFSVVLLVGFILLFRSEDQESAKISN